MPKGQISEQIVASILDKVEILERRKNFDGFIEKHEKALDQDIFHSKWITLMCLFYFLQVSILIW